MTPYSDVVGYDVITQRTTTLIFVVMKTSGLIILYFLN